MFTLDDSIKNLCKYIIDNHEFLLDEFNSTHDDPYRYNISEGELSIKRFCFCIMSVKIKSNKILLYNTEHKSTIKIVKMFNIPDFHYRTFGGSYIRLDEKPIPKPIDYNRSYLSINDDRLYVSDDEFISFKQIDIEPICSIFHLDPDGMGCTEESKMRLSTHIHRIEQCFGNQIIKYIYFNPNTIDVELLFKQIPNLKYVWSGNTEYSIENGKLCCEEYDYRLRYAQIFSENVLLEGDYRKRYCVTDQNYGSKH